MLRRFTYGLIGGLLSSGAPIGLMAIRLVQHHRAHSRSPRRGVNEVAADPTGYTYIGLSTAIAFTLFGYLLGRQADRLAALSETDALTGLHNARGLWERLHAEVARSQRYHHPLALLLVDLDGLKRINDRHGHRAGDLALRQVATAVHSALRATDVGARWGGDEFAILAPNTSEPAALAIAERVRALIARERVPWRLTASLGVATIDHANDDERIDSTALMRIADAALYEAKRLGGNTVSTGHWDAALHLPPPSSPSRGEDSSNYEDFDEQTLAAHRDWGRALRPRRGADARS